MEHFVIVGGGLAAHQAAKSIIAACPLAHVSMVSAEQQLPYDRPHLSKGFLASEGLEPALLSETQIYTSPQLTLFPGISVVEIDRAASRICLKDGKFLGYDKLVIVVVN
ncbi:FAD-dependent oxidoreductase [Pseudomonas syringae]|uniref:Ferredoxin reductase n=1 Tax=Pseudomonas syringae pv. daphniphylli TaxID=264455 RepID=A0A9X0H1R1_PSESX|nr:FAD-dependent oxidoreductase [Pseudomonas syringae]KPX09272.1 putative ferredoxin reductase [Pseudomonas syringae pv. daphniphylli]KWS85714.1 hypothetical protein AL050_26745 [Pseudomonas syringae pv. daphniphylli]